MKVFAVLILAVVAVVVQGGTRRARPGEEAKALDIWNRHCTNGREGGKEDDIYIHCKHPLESLTRDLTGSVDSITKGFERQQEQYIFVQPPSVHFEHNLDVKGAAGLEPKTIVYVKPAKTSHTYRAEVVLPEGGHTKPELVFLSGQNANPTTTTAPIVKPKITFNSGSHGGPDHVVIPAASG